MFYSPLQSSSQTHIVHLVGTLLRVGVVVAKQFGFLQRDLWHHISLQSDNMLLSAIPLLLMALIAPFATCFQLVAAPRTSSSSSLWYEPQWKKKSTLADDGTTTGDFSSIGLKGTVPVVFHQGEEVKRTMAIPGQPLRDVATQAGQFIKYGCGKGECGTCEALVNGQWIRPCSTFVPGDLEATEEYVVRVKDVAVKAKSSGKFFSIRSFIMGFYNNFLGMVGFVKYRKHAKENWNERQEYEDLIRRKTLEKKQARMNEKNQNLSP